METVIVSVLMSHIHFVVLSFVFESTFGHMINFSTYQFICIANVVFLCSSNDRYGINWNIKW